MKKQISIVFIAAFLVSLVVNAHASVKPGTSCKKLGLTTTFLGKSFTCIKSGRNLVWSKGKALSKKSAVAAGTPTPITSPSPTPTSTTAPAPIVLNFENVVANYREISRVTYSHFELSMQNNFQSTLKVNIHIGPNSKPNILDPLLAYAKASKILRNFNQPEEVHAIYYAYRDKDWAKKTTHEKDGTSRWDYQFQYECLSDDNCRGASAGMTQTGKQLADLR